MAGRSNRYRRRHRGRGAKLDPEPSDSSSPQSSSSQQVAEEEPDLRRTPDARAARPFLLGLIRGYYTDAISRLPAAELRTTLARGLLVGGHCYGPLHPVHNIIFNSVWYAAAFPSRATTDSDPIDVDVITSEGITRLAHRSLDGLIAYLCHQCPALSRDDALWHLSVSHAGHGAAASARGALSFGRMDLEAVPFEVAAQAARHPKPAALALFATSVLPAVERDALSLLPGKRRLSSHDILRLSAVLQPLQLPDEVQPQPCPPRLSVRINRIIAERRRCLRMWYQTLLDIVDAALRKFARETGARYCLHTTYGQSIVEVGDHLRERYYHVNFMAWPKGKQNQSQTPVHFFAEAHNPPPAKCSEEKITLCCILVQSQQTPRHVGADNCCACAKSKRRIDHPNGEEHFGGHPHKTGETEDVWDLPITVDVDYRFFDPDRDIDIVKYYAAKIAYDEAIYSKLCSDRPKCHFAEDGDDDEVDQNDEDIAEEDISNYCRRYI